jgi:hypothetical protein
VVLAIIIPAPWAKSLLLLGVCLGCFAFVRKSQWTHEWRTGQKYSVASGIVIALLIVAVPQLVSEWRIARAPRFVFVTPGFASGDDSWDFIVRPKGLEPQESIDVEFIDVNKLEFLQHNSPPGVAVFPREYSLLLHYDKLFPHNLGSLFAKQFLWKPFSFEHGHYASNISASTGRFHEDLYIESIGSQWRYAASVTEIDTHHDLFTCKDPLFPAAVATDIISTGKCWPEMMEE